MPVAQADVMDLLCILSEEEKLKVTVKEAVKGGVITGATAAAGALVIGPLGLAVGGLVGGCAAAYLAHNKFKSVAEVLQHLEPAQQEKLYGLVTKIMNDIQVTDVAALAALMAGNYTIRRQILEALFDFIRYEVRMEIVD